MDIIQQLYQLIVVQPVYNGLVALYSTIGQSDSGTTFVLVGIISAALFMPAIIRNYFDQEQVKAYQEQIASIQSKAANAEQKQQQVLAFLKSKGVRFQSESVFLFGQAIILLLLYPILSDHWDKLNPDLLYNFIAKPEHLSPAFLNISLTRSSPTLSLLPAILLFLELRQSYKEQQFLTSLIDKWYPVILPLFTYFLIFWLPSGISLVMTASLIMSLYLKAMLAAFTRMRRTQRLKAT